MNVTFESPTRALRMSCGGLRDLLDDVGKVDLADQREVRAGQLPVQLLHLFGDQGLNRAGTKSVGADQKDPLDPILRRDPLHSGNDKLVGVAPV